MRALPWPFSLKSLVCEPVPGQSLTLARMGADGGVARIEVGNTVTFVVAADGKRWHLGGVVIDVVLDRYVVAVPGDIIQQSGIGLRWSAFAVGKRGMTMTFIQVCKTQADIEVLRVIAAPAGVAGLEGLPVISDGAGEVDAGGSSSYRNAATVQVLPR